MEGSVKTAASQGMLAREQESAVTRLLASQIFATAPRLREVLAYLVQALENGTTEQLSEQTIGQEVFGKAVGYNASEDNIVRVTIRHLRSRLDEYYRAEGRGELWILTIPKGKYVPLLLPGVPKSADLPRLDRLLDESALATEVNRPVPASLAVEQDSRTTWGWISQWHLWILVALFAGMAFGYLLKTRGDTLPRVSSGVLGRLCQPGGTMSVIVVDSNLHAYRQIFHRQVTLDEYIQRTYAKEALDTQDTRVADAQRFATGGNETNVSSAIVSAALKQALVGRHVSIKHPHDVSIREFQDQEDIVLLGGPYINPWGQLFENHLNFRLSTSPSAPASSFIQNVQPAAGEPSDYVAHMDGTLNVNYVRIAILPNFRNSAHVILMGATSAEALEAAGVYLLSNESVTELLSIFHAQSFEALPALEFVLEVRGLDSVPDNQRIVSHRSISDSNAR